MTSQILWLPAAKVDLKICFDFPRNSNWVETSCLILLVHSFILISSECRDCLLLLTLRQNNIPVPAVLTTNIFYKHLFCWLLEDPCVVGYLVLTARLIKRNYQKILISNNFWKYLTELIHKPEPEVWPPSNGLFIQQLKCDIRILQD